jgi:hypothetical protein
MAHLRTLLQSQGLSCGDDFLALIFKYVLYQVIELHSWQAPFAAGLPARPRASAYCRDAALHGGRTVTLLHHSVDLSDPILRVFVTMLDGNREPASLIDALRLSHPDLPEEKLIEGMGPALEFLYRRGLFVDDEFATPKESPANPVDR